MNYKDMTIREIASEVRKDWRKPYFGAVPYLQAMSAMNDINSDYGCDDGRSIIMYFLSNATTWKGEVAREVKKELNKRLKQK